MRVLITFMRVTRDFFQSFTKSIVLHNSMEKIRPTQCCLKYIVFARRKLISINTFVKPQKCNLWWSWISVTCFFYTGTGALWDKQIRDQKFFYRQQGRGGEGGTEENCLPTGEGVRGRLGVQVNVVKHTTQPKSGDFPAVINKDDGFLSVHKLR